MLASLRWDPRSCVCHSMWVSWWAKRKLGRPFSEFLLFSPVTNFTPPFLHIHFIHFVSFHFIHPCDGASGVVDWDLYYSQTFTYLISRTGPVRTRLEDIYRPIGNSDLKFIVYLG